MLVILFIHLFLIFYQNIQIIVQYGNSVNGFERNIATHKHTSTKYSREERMALEQFRRLAAADPLLPNDEYYKRDSFLIRFLRERNNEVRPALEMVKQTYQWRMDNNIDTILSENILNFSKPLYHFDGHDKEGRPILYLTTMHVDVRKLIIGGKGGDLLRHFDQLLETCFQYLKHTTDRMKNGDEIIDFTVIGDLQGFNIKMHGCIPCLKFYIPSLYHIKNYYPGALKNVIVVNAPRTAVPILNQFYPIVFEGNEEIMKIFGTDKKESSTYLLSIINADQLPENLGGTRTTLQL